MQTKAGDSAASLPDTTLATALVGRHHSARHKLRTVLERRALPSYQKCRLYKLKSHELDNQEITFICFALVVGLRAPYNR